MLHVSNIVSGYSNTLAVLNGINFSIKQGEIVALLGSNGAGKTTTLRSVAGLLKPWDGNIVFNGEDITGMPAYETILRGLSLVPEGRLLFDRLTVHENLILGAFTRKDKAEIAESLELVYKLFPVVKERSSQKAGTLSGGEQQMVAIGRGLMSKPKLLILDEPSLGLAPILVQEVFKFIKAINDEGLTILLVEQNAKETLALADRVYVIQDGKTIISATPSELEGNDDVRKAYLGI